MVDGRRGWRWESRLFSGRYDCVEAHVHGPVLLADHVEAVVLTPAPGAPVANLTDVSQAPHQPD